MATRTALHNNGHQLAAIGMLTTGGDPEIDDIIELSILPINSNCEPYQEYNPFSMQFKPARVMNYEIREVVDESIRMKLANKVQFSSAKIHGTDPIDVISLLQLWVKNLKLPYKKRLMPVATNWPKSYAFLMKWLGREDYELIFDWRYRDICATANYANDKADFNCVPAIYQKHHLRWVSTQLKVQFANDGDSLEEAIAVAETYRRMLKELY